MTVLELTRDRRSSFGNLRTFFEDFHARNNAHLLHVAYRAPLPPLSSATRLLFVTSEMADFVKAGGLGDVSASLPRHLREICDVRVLLPGYRSVLQAVKELEIVSVMPGEAGLPSWTLARVQTPDRLTIYVILCDELYDRDGTPYGPSAGVEFQDNDLRFARLSIAAAEIAAGRADPSWKPDVLHCNDWPSALAPAYMSWRDIAIPSILTVHNLAYQGLFDPSRRSLLSIPESAFSVHGVEFHGKISFLKAGIYYSSSVTTVSETYAREILTQEHGCGLQGILQAKMRDGALHGIVNGIEDGWGWDDPDDHLSEQEIAELKREHSNAVRSDYHMKASAGPLFAIISRLVHQKGVDLTIQAADKIVANGGQIVFIGTGDPQIESQIKGLANRFHGNVVADLNYDEDRARQLYSASDFLLMPSRFEPCGISQMYAQKVASLPIARKTGGLADTIDDGRSGFLFTSPTLPALFGAVSRAFSAYRSGMQLNAMRRIAMSGHFDWTASVQKYGRVYRGLFAS